MFNLYRKVLTQNTKRPKPKIVRTHHYEDAYVTVMGVQIICYLPDSHQYHNAVYWRTEAP